MVPPAFLIPARSSEPGSQHFRNKLDEIWKSLMDSCDVIPIVGMGGLGKTTLARHICSRALRHPSTFDNVYWVAASRMYGARELQDNVSRAIGLDISFEDDEVKRAAMLSTKLTTRSGCVLMVLDDLWYSIRLQELGIPVNSKGFKIIVTSRSFDLCRELGSQKIFKIDILTDQEAFDLFLYNLRRSELDPPIEQIAKSVARTYRGLPYVIISLASSLRNVFDIQEWEDVHRAMNEDYLFQVLKLGYKRLNDPKVQQCFLYCGLYLEDHVMERERLINLLIAEDLVDGVSSVEKLGRGHAIIDKLIGSALLQEDIDNMPCVKMHPLIRDMALKILAGDSNVEGSMILPDSDVVASNSNEWRVTILGTTIQSFQLQATLEWIFVVTNLILETLSAFFDQISSPKTPQYSLVGMVMSFSALLICIVELGHRIRKERVIRRQCWFYHPSPSNRPLGTFAENFGLICAVSQCLFSTIQYGYLSHQKENPIKLSVFPIMLAGYLVYLQFTKMR